MRWLLDILAIAMAGAIVVGGILWHRERELFDARANKLADDVKLLDRTIRIHAATNDAVERNGRGWPTTVDPHWFTERLPVNCLLDPENPWLEVAGPDQTHLVDPPVRIAVGWEYAGFWYNPANGAVRARVPAMVSDQAALALYNRVNGTKLTSIFADTRADSPQLAEAPAAPESSLPPESDPTQPPPDLQPIDDDAWDETPLPPIRAGRP